ncbi:MAG: NorD protein [Bacteroidia bacterium]
MSVDEFLFGRFNEILKNRQKKRSALTVNEIQLSDIRNKLTLLARAVSGRPIDIYPAEKEGGVRGDNFFLPEKSYYFSSPNLNLKFYYFRVLYLSVQQELNIYLPTNANAATDSLSAAITSSKRILETLFCQYPAVQPIYSELLAEVEKNNDDKRSAPVYNLLFGRLMMAPEPTSTDQSLNYQPTEFHKNSITPQTIIKSKAVEEIKSILLDKKAQEDYVLTHNFEKVDTADEFNGVWRDFDGEDELKDHKNALDELNLRFTVRVNDPVHSVYQSEFLENTNVPESKGAEKGRKGMPYDEWDYKKKKYKKDFCTVYPATVSTADSIFCQKVLSRHSALFSELRKMMANINNRLRQQRRQNQGNEIDIDAVTDHFKDIFTGHTPSENVYLNQRKKEKDLSVFLLLDASLSSDSYVNGNKVIEIEKEIAVLFGETLHEFDIDFSIAGFYSNTRNHTTFISLKDFDMEWNIGKQQISGLEPSGYTRIGTSIRHASNLLHLRPAQNKWMILLSDGKPNDYDRYEGKYGIEDTRQGDERKKY